MSILLLGGTSRARQLATCLVEAGFDVTTSLAGRTTKPAAVAGKVRVGGFGGAIKMAEAISQAGYSCVIDATHPFAAQISTNAVAACHAAGVPLVRLEPPSWCGTAEAEQWLWEADHDVACQQVVGLPGRVLLTVGRQPLVHYLPLAERDVTARVLEPPEIELPSSWQLAYGVGPFPIEQERVLLAEVGVLVTKDAGGPIEAKLLAARELGVQVVVIERPVLPPADQQFTTPTEVLDWLAVAANQKGCAAQASGSLTKPETAQAPASTNPTDLPNR